MINEAAKTLMLLKGTLDELRAGRLDVDTAQRRLRNFSRVNGLDWTHRAEQAVTHFMEVAADFTANGNVVNYAQMTETTRRQNYEDAVEALRGYREALRDAKISGRHQGMGTVDETEVEEPNF